MADYFRWINCYADGEASQHPQTTRTFLAEIITPSLDALDRKIEGWSESDDPVAYLVISDLHDLRKSTIEAYALAIQSLWERQLRRYVCAAARELEPSLEEKANKASWEDLEKLFAKLRGIAVRHFGQYDVLQLLHLLGNVCRHGNGPSLNDLAVMHPGLWPGPPTGFDLDDQPITIKPNVYSMEIKRELLIELVEAVAGFWEVMEYIYIESINPKHESTIRRLPELRRLFGHLIEQNSSIRPE